MIFFFLGLPAAALTLANGWGDVRDWLNDRDKPAADFDRTPNAGLEFWQDDELAPMVYRDEANRVVRVALDPKPFYVRLPSVDDETALEICAWTDASLLRHAPDPSEPVPAHRIPCMRLGRGAADYDYGSGRLFLSDEGRNYFIGTRLRPYAGGQDQAFFARTSTLESGDKKLTEQKQPIYLLVYIDRSRDRLIDPGEFEAIELTF